MIVVVEHHNAEKHSDLLDQMFRLRKRVFNDRLGWDVAVSGEHERDRYDDEGPVYILYTDPHTRRVTAGLRLLPTTGPTLLRDFFADTLPDAAALSAPTIWECTRFCVDEQALAQDGREGLLHTSGSLIAGLGAVALRAGIETILGNFERPMLRVYRRIGCDLEILGCTQRFGRPVYLGAFHVSEAILRTIKERLAIFRPAAVSPVAAYPALNPDWRAYSQPLEPA